MIIIKINATCSAIVSNRDVFIIIDNNTNVYSNSCLIIADNVLIKT